MDANELKELQAMPTEWKVRRERAVGTAQGPWNAKSIRGYWS